MSDDELRAAVRRFFDEVWNKGNVGETEAFLAPEFVSHNTLDVRIVGPASTARRSRTTGRPSRTSTRRSRTCWSTVTGSSSAARTGGPIVATSWASRLGSRGHDHLDRDLPHGERQGRRGLARVGLRGTPPPARRRTGLSAPGSVPRRLSASLVIDQIRQHAQHITRSFVNQLAPEPPAGRAVILPETRTVLTANTALRRGANQNKLRQHLPSQCSFASQSDVSRRSARHHRPRTCGCRLRPRRRAARPPSTPGCRARRSRPSGDRAVPRARPGRG